MYDLIIIGGGPAGLCAGVYAARKQLKTLLVSGDIGGQVNWTMGVENYLGYQFIEGMELIDKFQTQVAQFPIDQKIGDKVACRTIASEVEIVVEGHIECRGQIWFRAFHILNYITKQVMKYFYMRLSRDEQRRRLRDQFGVGCSGSLERRQSNARYGL